VENHQFKDLKIKGAYGTYLGSLAPSKVLLFIGRSNTQKNSAPLQELLNRLLLDGYLLVWPKSRNQSIGELLTKESLWAVSWLNKIFGQNEPPMKVWARRIVKGLILISHPSKWGYFVHWLSDSQMNEQTLINRQAIHAVGDHKSIIIMSHSAGGITASQLTNEANVCGIICFGYPFKHPDKEEEIYRTDNLRSLQKPLLIIQGTKDEYGGLEVLSRYELSPNIEFEFVEANHDYESLSANDWGRVTERIASFISQQSKMKKPPEGSFSDSG